MNKITGIIEKGGIRPEEEDGVGEAAGGEQRVLGPSHPESSGPN